MRKILLKKKLNAAQSSLTVAGLTMILQRFEETESLEDRVRSRRPSLRQTRSAIVAAEMKTLESENAAEIRSTREAGGRLGLPPSSALTILH